MKLRNGLTAREAALAGRYGAHLSWSKTIDRAARTAPARAAREARFVESVRRDHLEAIISQVGHDHPGARGVDFEKLVAVEVDRLATHALRAEMSRIGLLGSRARREAQMKRAAAVFNHRDGSGDDDADATATPPGE